MGEPAKYILLVDRALSTLASKWYWLVLHRKCEALRGDIFKALPEAEQPSDGDSIVLQHVKFAPCRLRCSKKDVTRLSDEEANLLLSISCLEERYATFIDTKRLDFGRRLSPGKAVFVSEKGHTKDLPGVVRYKGELPTCPGTMFGVELTENPGQGNSDETFGDRRYFTCPPSSAVFVGLDKLRPRKVSDSKSSERDGNAQANFKSRLESRHHFGPVLNTDILASRRILDSKSSKRGENAEANFKSRLDKKGKSQQESPQEGIKQVLGIKQRVVTFIEDCPARGTVCYIGNEEDGSGNMRTIVGLEMDEKCGSGTGKRNGRQFFVCRNDFAAFVDIRNLLREEDFDGNHEETTCTGKKTQDKQEAVHKEIRKDGINLSENDQQEENSRRQLRAMEQLREKDEQEEHLRRQLREMEQQLREKDEQEENLQKQRRALEQQLREKEEQEENLQRQQTEMEQQLEEKDEQEENLQRQLRALEQRLREKDEQEENSQRQQREMERQLREKDEQEEHLRRQLREMEQQLREKDEQEENLQKQRRALEQQLREKEEQEENLQRQQTEMEQQLEEKDEQEENLQRQLRALEQRLREKDEQEENSQRQQREMERQLREKDEQEENLQRQLRALEQRLREKDEQEENSQRQQREMEQQLREKDEQEENSQRHQREMEQQLTNLQDRYRQKEDETANLHEQVNELEVTLSTAQQVLSEHQRRQVTPDWVISRDQIQLTDKLLGRGGWGSVVEGKYCSCSVAVKQIHELILSPHNRTLFEREMAIASRCRHPCLLQFIGATNDEGSPLFVTELMESSLRALLEQRHLAGTEVSIISLDVARALNYLHQKKPSPIIHRDISSANVLLWRQGNQWRGKVSDYGTANFMKHTMTVGSGAVIYMAPEALTPNQTVKVDVYSFGVLLCEMCIQELPDPERRDQQIAMVKYRLLRALIRRCLPSDPEARPNMEEIIEELEEPV